MFKKFNFRKMNNAETDTNTILKIIYARVNFTYLFFLVAFHSLHLIEEYD